MPGIIVPVALALLAGVACSGAWPRAHAAASMLAATGAGALLVAVMARTRSLAVAALVLLAFGAGWRLGLHAHDRALARPIRDTLAEVLRPVRAGEVTWLEGRLREDAGLAPGSVVLVVDVHRARLADRWTPTTGGVRLGLHAGEGLEAALSWRRGRCVRLPVLLRVPSSFRNPGGTDADLDLARRGIALVGTVKSAALVEVCGPGTWAQERAGHVRERLRAAIARHVAPHDPLSAAIVLAIVLGDRAAIDDEVEERLRRAGTYHVIAISGGNIAILTGVLVWMASWSRAPPRVTAGLAIAGLVAYAVLVVRGASVDRAVLVAVVYLAARMADVRAHPLALLASTATALLLWDPLVAFDVGFALTFGATAGLILAVPPLVAWWNAAVSPRVQSTRLRDALGAAFTLLAATVAAELAVVPIAATVFGRVTLAGLALNFVAVPMMALVQLAGLITVALAHAVPALADWSGWVAHLGVRALVDSARLADWWPWLQRITPPPAPGLLVLHAAAVAAACASALCGRLRTAAAVAAACTCAAIAGGWWPAAPAAFGQAKHFAGASARPVLGITVLDVGQGDCVVVQFPAGSVMVVDTGGLAASPRFDIGRRVVAPALHAIGARAVSWLVLTHGDPDHIGGAAALIDDWRPREVWEGVPVARHGPGLALRKLASRHGVAWRAVRAGDHVTIDGVDVRAWHPPPPDWERQRVRNDDSVVLELRYGDVSIVLPGDIGAAVEDRLAEGDWPRRLRVLKAAHHGSAGSSSRRWLAALGPSAVVYSAGRGNPFGHPAASALQRAAQAGADTFRTDEDGAVHVATDGERVAIETMSGRRWMRKAS